MDRGIKAGLLLLVAGLMSAAAASTAAAAPYRYSKGDPVRIGGTVTDVQGAPLPNVTVVLEMSRTRFKLSRFRRQKGNTLRVPAITGADGRYAHDWRWDGYYNTFELAVALPVRRGGREDFEIFHRVEITGNVRQGSPVTMPLVVEQTGYLEWLRRFLSGAASDEERQIYGEMGRPDRLDSDERLGTSWWYFAAGKVYRFQDGALKQVQVFDPIESP